MTASLQRLFDRHNPAALFLWWALGILAFYTLFYQLGWINRLPNVHNLRNWDAGWYDVLREKGYEYYPGEASNSGFFPLFAWFWKFTHLPPAGISLLNLVLALTGMAMLVRLFKPEVSDLAIVLTVPSMFFLYVPYSEALFFLFSCIIFWGVVKNENRLTATGIFLASLTRPTMFFLLPALLLMEFLNYDRQERPLKILRRIALVYLLPCVAGLAIVVLVQWMQTGVWLAYFEVQHDSWGRQFALPTLPFGSPYGVVPLWLDAAALWASLLCLGCLGYFIFQRFRSKAAHVDKTLVLSTAFIVLACSSIVFFNPVWIIGRTILNGLNRYVFVNPFFIVFFLWLFREKTSWKPGILVFFIITAPVLFLVEIDEIPRHPVLLASSLPAYLLLFFWYKTTRSQAAFLLIFIVNTALQAFYFGYFISDWWVG